METELEQLNAVCTRTSVIGLVASEDAGNFESFGELLDGINTVLKPAGRTVRVVMLKKDSKDLLSDLCLAVEQMHLDGFLIFPCERMFQARVRQALRMLQFGIGTPYVWLNVQRTMNAVYADDLVAGRQATELLLRQGHRRIAYMDLTADNNVRRINRCIGYERAMHALGLAPQIIRENHMRTKLMDRAHFAMPTLVGRDRPTAIVTCDPNTLLPLHRAAVEGAGLRLPKDLGLITFVSPLSYPCVNGSYPAEHVRAFEIPLREVGRKAAMMLSQRLDSPEREIPSQTVNYYLHDEVAC